MLCKALPSTASLATCIGVLGKLCLQSFLVFSWLLSGSLRLVGVFILYHYPRFETVTTNKLAGRDEQMREELLHKLVQEKLLGPTTQVTDLVPKDLPLRELPPGNTAALFLMYIAWARVSGEQAASKSTFYATSKKLACCLKFRSRSEHSMCVLCQSLKSAIHAARDLISVDIGKHFCQTTFIFLLSLS